MLRLENDWFGDQRLRAVWIVEAATIPVPGESVSNLANVVAQLKKERDRAKKRVEQLDEALSALTHGGGQRRIDANRNGPRRKTMSAAARKRIAAAQRARWAKWKAAHRGK